MNVPLPSDLHRRILELHAWQPAYKWSITLIREHIEDSPVAIRAARDWLLRNQYLEVDGAGGFRPTPAGIGEAGPNPSGKGKDAGSESMERDDEPPAKEAVLVQPPVPTPPKRPIAKDLPPTTAMIAYLRVVGQNSGKTLGEVAKKYGKSTATCDYLHRGLELRGFASTSLHVDGRKHITITEKGGEYLRSLPEESAAAPTPAPEPPQIVIPAPADAPLSPTEAIAKIREISRKNHEEEDRAIAAALSAIPTEALLDEVWRRVERLERLHRLVSDWWEAFPAEEMRKQLDGLDGGPP